jgi:hypothetical protein
MLKIIESNISRLFKNIVWDALQMRSQFITLDEYKSNYKWNYKSYKVKSTKSEDVK